MTKTLSDFFLGDINQDPLEDQSRSELARGKWRCRSLLLHNNRLIGGKVKPEVVSMDMADSVFESASQSGSVRGAGGQRIVDPLHRPPGASRQDSRTSRSSHLPPARQWSTVSSGRRSLRHTARRLQRKESVVKMAYDGCKDWMVRFVFFHKLWCLWGCLLLMIPCEIWGQFDWRMSINGQWKFWNWKVEKSSLVLFSDIMWILSV